MLHRSVKAGNGLGEIRRHVLRSLAIVADAADQVRRRGWTVVDCSACGPAIRGGHKIQPAQHPTTLILLHRTFFARMVAGESLQHCINYATVMLFTKGGEVKPSEAHRHSVPAPS
jgi:hypothetical protein